MIKRAGRRGVWLAGLLVATRAVVLGAQARPPLPVAVDSSGVLTAIRAVDLRQLCRCPTVMLDSVVRRGPRISMFELVHEPAGFVLSAADVARLDLARHRVRRTAVRSMSRYARDTAFMVAQVLTGRPNPQVLLSVAPPTRITAAYLVSLRRDRGRWRVDGTRSVFDP